MSELPDYQSWCESRETGKSRTEREEKDKEKDIHRVVQDVVTDHILGHSDLIKIGEVRHSCPLKLFHDLIPQMAGNFLVSSLDLFFAHFIPICSSANIVFQLTQLFSLPGIYLPDVFCTFVHSQKPVICRNH